MTTKIIFLLSLLSTFFVCLDIMAQEEISISTYYPAPYGAYRQITLGSGVKQPKDDNTITLMRIGVTNDDAPNGTTYLKAKLEIGGIAYYATPTNGGELPDDFGLFAQGDVGICGASASDNMPAIIGYKPLLTNDTPAQAPAILGMGSQIGVKGMGTVTGVEGEVSYTSPATYGVGYPHHYAICGRATSNTDHTNALAGVYGIVNVLQQHDLTDAYGVYGEAEDYGVYGKSPKYGIYGEGTGDGIGIYGQGVSTAIEAKGTGDTSCGVHAYSFSSVNGTPSELPANKRIGVYGEATDYGIFGRSFAKYGVYGYSEYSSGTVGFSKSQAGIAGINRDTEPSPPDFSIPGNCGGYFEGINYGIYAKCPNSGPREYAGYFEGNVWVNGNLVASQVSANIKNFVIDHPVNKDMLLRHSCLEGPEAGIYQRGRVKLENKEAIIELPDYFKALCKNTPTISLTPISELALVSYKELEKGKRYKIFSDKDNIEVDWIIIAKREEIIVEEEKHEK